MTTQTHCQNCNTALEEGILFCPQCGTKTETFASAPVPVPAPVPAPVPVPVPAPSYEKIFCPECGTETTAEFVFCPECGKPLMGKEQEVSSDGTDSPVKKAGKFFDLLRKPLFIGVTAAVMVVLVALIALVSLGGKSSSSHLIYVKDKELQFTYLSKIKPIELTDKLFDSYDNSDAEVYRTLEYYILLSDDERYIYYPDRAEDNGVSYYWRDLKSNKKDYAVKIDSEINQIPFLTKDGSKLFYIKGDDDRLYVFDRKSGEKEKLDNDVNNFYVDSSGNYIIYNKYIDGEHMIYEMTLKGLSGEKNKLDSNSTIYTAYPNEKKVYYTKDGSFYLKESGADKVKITSDMNRVVSIINGTSVYYIKSEEITSKLSNFVRDDMVSNDRTITEPVYPAYTTAPSPASEYDYQTEVWVDSWWGSDRHPDTNEWGYWTRETDQEAYNEANRKYEREYAEWVTENDRLESEYQVSALEYQKKEFRDELREALENEDHAVSYLQYSLYYWNKGTESLVATDLASGNYSYLYYLASSSASPVVVYQKYSTSSSDVQDLSELLSEMGEYYYVYDVVYDMQNKISSLRTISDDIYVALQEKETIMSDNENARQWSVGDNGIIYFLGDYNNDKNYGTLMSAETGKGTLSKPVKVDDDVAGFIHGNGTDNLIYYKDVKNGAGDIFINAKRIASDVYISSVYNFYGNNTILYYTDYSSKSESGTLCILKDGTEKKISDDVNSFVAIDQKKIVYLTDYNLSRGKGDMMLYNGGKKPVALDTDVAALLWNPNMSWSTYYYSYGY